MQFYHYVGIKYLCNGLGIFIFFFFFSFKKSLLPCSAAVVDVLFYYTGIVKITKLS